LFHAERPVNMARHDDTLEPKAVFTPGQKQLVFRSNVSGTDHVYAVELKRAVEPAGGTGHETPPSLISWLVARRHFCRRIDNSIRSWSAKAG